MTPLLVASIPHTGTMFTYYLMPGKRGGLPGPVLEGHKYVCHLSEPHATEAMSRCFTVVPLRQYAQVRASWERRGLDLEQLEEKWDQMTSLRDVFFLPIDTTDRERRLAELSREIGVTLRTDWRPANSIRPDALAAEIA